MPERTDETTHQPHLLRRLNLLQATALNMTNMVGIGPFITIPLIMTALGGPQAMLGWLVALIIVAFDGMIWSELGAAMPGSGGSYVYLREGFGPQTFGRLMAFLFIWQFILSGPLEIASGYIGFANYLGYLWHGMTKLQTNLVVIGVGVVTIALLYRRITTIGALTLSLWIGMLLTVGAVIVSGALHFNPRLAFDFPPHAFDFSHGDFHFWLGFLFGLSKATRFGVYDYLGYYDICYIGDEVKHPGRVIPRSIFLSVIVIAILYVAINFSIIGTVPWRTFVPADTHPDSNFVASILMQHLYGPTVAKLFTVMMLWTAFGSVFALLLGYSRIPYAAALDGNFFPIFARRHPRKNFPYVAVIVIGVISIVCGFFSLDQVIDVLIATRLVVQFIAQIVAVTLLRKRAPDMERPYRIWLYPLPNIIALVGWVFLFATSGRDTLLWGLGTLALGVLFFLGWSWRSQRWPCAPAPAIPGD